MRKKQGPKSFTERHVVQENVNLCDLFATLCDMADIPCPEGLESRSLVPLMQGDACKWDNETISQFGGRNLMIKRDHLKYQYYGKEMPEVLFDLQKDPGETINFINNPEYADLFLHSDKEAGNLDLGYRTCKGWNRRQTEIGLPSLPAEIFPNGNIPIGLNIEGLLSSMIPW